MVSAMLTVQSGALTGFPVLTGTLYIDLEGSHYQERTASDFITKVSAPVVSLQTVSGETVSATEI